MWEVWNQFFKRRRTENSLCLFFFFLSLFKEDHHSSSRISPFLQIKVLCVHLYLHSYISPKSTHCNSQGCHFGSSIIFFNDFFASFPPEKFPLKKKTHNSRCILSNQIYYLMSRVASYHGTELFQHLQYLARFCPTCLGKLAQYLQL